MIGTMNPKELLYLAVATIHLISHYYNQYGNEDYPYNIVVSSEMFFHTSLLLLFKYYHDSAFDKTDKIVTTIGILA